jgi:hypothetical protein
VLEQPKNGHLDGQKEDSQLLKVNIIALLEKEMLMEELYLKLISEHVSLLEFKLPD